MKKRREIMEEEGESEREKRSERGSGMQWRLSRQDKHVESERYQKKNHVLSSSLSSQFRHGVSRGEKRKRETKMCVGDFFAFGEDSFFLPVAFAAGSTRPLRDINYIFQRWMQFRNKNPLNMSDSCKLLIPFSKEKKRKEKIIT